MGHIVIGISLLIGSCVDYNNLVIYVVYNVMTMSFNLY